MNCWKALVMLSHRKSGQTATMFIISMLFAPKIGMR